MDDKTNLIEETELNVKQSRRSFDDISGFAVGAVSALRFQGILSESAHHYLESLISRMETQVNKIEIEYHKLRQYIQDTKGE